MRGGDFARLVHELALVAMRDGVDGSVLVKSALAGVMAATDPDDRIAAVDVKIRMSVKREEISIALTTDDKPARPLSESAADMGASARRGKLHATEVDHEAGAVTGSSSASEKKPSGQRT